jgi:hypothetical protein
VCLPSPFTGEHGAEPVIGPAQRVRPSAGPLALRPPASFQFDLQGLLTHDDIAGVAALKGKTILAASSAYTAWWPWLK